ncbi:MAG: hypothetical protein K6E18_05825 [Lachnospiraceae bacterium]|nr:hypothetical protein [Lachnospiraceae bacterium]
MACFLVPATEAIVTTIVKKAVEAKEQPAAVESSTNALGEESVKIPFSAKMGWLNKMLWGGSALLAFEHVWHGELAPYFPFLTAAETAEGARTMLHEMATTGTLMAALVTLTWAGMVVISNKMEKKTEIPIKQEVKTK